jgi:peroxiredoxin
MQTKRSIVLGAFAALLTAAMVASSSTAVESKPVAAVGAPAPAFTLQDQTGKPVSLADFSGKVVVLEWFNNECPFVQKHYKNGDMNRLAKSYTDKGVVWLAINSTKGKTNADNAAISAEWNMSRPILNDATGATGHAYGAKTTPHMYIVGADGKLAYAGAIDDKRSSDSADIASSKNYVSAALDELLAGKAVSQAETASYGCSVKYAK